jgi:hypothetical protein
MRARSIEESREALRVSGRKVQRSACNGAQMSKRDRSEIAEQARNAIDRRSRGRGDVSIVIDRRSRAHEPSLWARSIGDRRDSAEWRSSKCPHTEEKLWVKSSPAPC